MLKPPFAGEVKTVNKQTHKPICFPEALRRLVLDLKRQTGKLGSEIKLRKLRNKFPRGDLWQFLHLQTSSTSVVPWSFFYFTSFSFSLKPKHEFEGEKKYLKP